MWPAARPDLAVSAPPTPDRTHHARTAPLAKTLGCPGARGGDLALPVGEPGAATRMPASTGAPVRHASLSRCAPPRPAWCGGDRHAVRPYEPSLSPPWR